MSKTSKKLPSTQVNNLERRIQEYEDNEVGFNSFIVEFLGSFLSPQTKKAYQKDLEAFFTFLKDAKQEITHPADIRSAHFASYRDILIENHYSSATINRKLVAIRSLVKWSVAKGLMDKNPLDAIKLPKIQTEKPTLALSDEEVQGIINTPNTENFKGETHRLVLILLFHLGLRRSELISLKWSNIGQDREHNTLTIHGKGSKVRIVPVPSQLLDELSHYKSRFQEVSGLTLESDDFIIQSKATTKNSKPIDGSTIYRIVSRYAKKCGIFRRIGAHSCRATVISHLLDTQFVPIRDVAHFAGHSNITTTERYDKKRKGLDDNAVYKVNFSDKAS